MEFKDRLKKLRENEKMTQQELANKIGVTRTAISTYENGTREPLLVKVKKIAEIFDCSIDFLVGTSDVKSKADSDYVIYYDKEEETKLKVSDLVKIYKMIKEFPK